MNDPTDHAEAAEENNGERRPSAVSFVLASARYGKLQSWGEDGQAGKHRLLLAESGQGAVWLDHREFRLFPGRCFLAPPGTRMSFTPETDDIPAVYELIFFGYVVAPDGFGEDGHTAVRPYRLPVSGELDGGELGAAIRSLAQAHAGTSERELFLQHRRFLALIDRIWELEERRRGSENKEAVARTIQRMEREYYEPLTRDMLAQEVGMSPGHYSTVFRKETGKSPMEYLAGLRMEKAKEMLLTSNGRIRDIALRAGFASEFYFSNKFKRFTGLSPCEFVSRNRSRKLTASHPRAFDGARPKPVRVVGLFVEDCLAVMGVKPVVQFALGPFRQRYLEEYLDQVRQFDPYSSDCEILMEAKPDIIVLGFPEFAEKGRFGRLANIAPTYVFEDPVEDWRQTLQTVGKLLGKEAEAERALHAYNRKAEEARYALERTVGGQTVALLRICKEGDIRLYGGPSGYTGSVLYGDLGLCPPKLVREWSWGESDWVKRITLEQLAGLQADHLLLIVEEQGRRLARAITDSEPWRHIPAVRRGSVHEVRSDVWMTFGPLAHSAKIDHVLSALVGETG